MKLKHIFLIFTLLSCIISHADSPLTSTPFHTAYSDVKEVKYALANGLDNKLLKFLGNKKAPIIHKIAVINALSWGEKDFVGKFENYLLKKRKGIKPEVFTQLRTIANSTPEETEQTKLLTADDLTCWVYLQVLGDYKTPAIGMRAGFLGCVRDRESMAHMIPFTLIGAQKAMDSDWCSVYKIPHDNLEQAVFSKNLISEKGLKIIMDYINLYKQDCTEK